MGMVKEDGRWRRRKWGEGQVKRGGGGYKWKWGKGKRMEGEGQRKKGSVNSSNRKGTKA